MKKFPKVIFPSCFLANHLATFQMAVRTEVTVSPCSTVLGATAMTLPSVIELCWGAQLACLPFLQLLSTVPAPGLLSMISLQVSLQESICLLVGGRARYWLW